jgi:truncated hemoglobin YjbI
MGNTRELCKDLGGKEKLHKMVS